MTCAKLAEKAKSLMSADTITVADTGSPTLEESAEILKVRKIATVSLGSCTAKSSRILKATNSHAHLILVLREWLICFQTK